MIKIFKSPDTRQVYIETVTFGNPEDFVYIRDNDIFTIDRKNTKVVEVNKVSYTFFLDSDGNTFNSAQDFESYLTDILTVDTLATVEDINKKWQDVTSSRSLMPEGSYNFKNLSSTIDFTLKEDSEIGSEWEFANSDFSIAQGSVEVNIGTPTDFFQNELGEYEQGELVIDTPNSHVKVIKSGQGRYDIVFGGIIYNFPN